MPTRQKTIGQMPPGTKINELFANLPARQISISSNCNLFNFHACKLSILSACAILSTCHFINLSFQQLLIMTHLSLPHKRLQTLASVPQLKYSSGSMKRRVDEMTWQRTVHEGMRGLKMNLKYMKGQRIQGC
jgi:hypothetical protein